jgi:hypothetical protein
MLITPSLIHSLTRSLFLDAVGHWLGLLHTFDGGCSTERTAYWGANPDYQLLGDGVADTPAHSGPTYASPDGIDSCWQNMSPKLNTCLDTEESRLAGMDIGDDPVDNYVSIPCGVSGRAR